MDRARGGGLIGVASVVIGVIPPAVAHTEESGHPHIGAGIALIIGGIVRGSCCIWWHVGPSMGGGEREVLADLPPQSADVGEEAPETHGCAYHRYVRGWCLARRQGSRSNAATPPLHQRAGCVFRQLDAVGDQHAVDVGGNDLRVAAGATAMSAPVLRPLRASPCGAQRIDSHRGPSRHGLTLRVKAHVTALRRAAVYANVTSPHGRRRNLLHVGQSAVRERCPTRLRARAEIAEGAGVEGVSTNLPHRNAPLEVLSRRLVREPLSNS